MKKRLLLLAITGIMFLNGCYLKYYQIAKTESNSIKPEKDFYSYSDENVELRYYLFNQNGTLNFSIYNKSSHPIFIDWTRCNFIVNNRSLSYYQDVERIETREVTNNYSYPKSLGVYNPTLSTGYVNYSSDKIKAERITHIPPSSGIIVNKFALGDYINIPGKYDFNNQNDKVKNTYTENYTKDNSPLKCRNYLSYSTDEKLDDIHTIDNDLWVSQIVHLTSKSHDKGEYIEEGNDIVTARFINPNASFFKVFKYSIE